MIRRGIAGVALLLLVIVIGSGDLASTAGISVPPSSADLIAMSVDVDSSGGGSGCPDDGKKGGHGTDATHVDGEQGSASSADQERELQGGSDHDGDDDCDDDGDKPDVCKDKGDGKKGPPKPRGKPDKDGDQDGCDDRDDDNEHCDDRGGPKPPPKGHGKPGCDDHDDLPGPKHGKNRD